MMLPESRAADACNNMTKAEMTTSGHAKQEWSSRQDFQLSTGNSPVSYLSKNLLDPGGSQHLSMSPIHGQLDSLKAVVGNRTLDPVALERRKDAVLGERQRSMRRGSAAEEYRFDSEYELLLAGIASSAQLPKGTWKQEAVSREVDRQQHPRPPLQSALRNGSGVGLPPKSATGAQIKTKKHRVTWKSQLENWPEYYGTSRNARDAKTFVEVSHNAPAKRSENDDQSASSVERLPPSSISKPVESEGIPVGDHWGSMKDAGMWIKRVMTDPEFASEAKTNQEKPAGFLSMLHTLFSHVQEAARPSNVQSASGSRRLLIAITVMGTVGALRLLVPADTLVEDVIKLALEAYSNEGRLPALGNDSTSFQLYLTPYTTTPFPKSEKICDTGARSFVLWGPSLIRPSQYTRISRSCAQEHMTTISSAAQLEASTYTSLHLYDSGTESPTECTALTRLHRQPWLASTLLRCIPV